MSRASANFRNEAVDVLDRETILAKTRECVLNCDRAGAVNAAREAMQAGLAPLDVLHNGLSVAMKEIGSLFERGEVFLPGVIQASETMAAALTILESHLPPGEVGGEAGTVVIGSIEGDIHDIGKGIVATLLKVYGFKVYDLGRDVPIKTFVEKAKELNANVVGTSALMTTTKLGQRKLEQELNRAGIREKVKTMVGGAAVTQRWADKIGADAYAETADEAVAKVKEMLSSDPGRQPPSGSGAGT